MASQDELDRMKKFIVQQLPEVEDESELETATEGLIEEAYEELMANLKANEEETTPAFDEEPETDDESDAAEESQSDTKSEDDSPGEKISHTRHETHKQSEPEDPDPEPKAEFPSHPLAQYQLLIEQLHGMAEQWVDRLGDDYIPFVESCGTGFVYGAENVQDAKLTRFSEVPIPNSIAEEIPEHKSETGAIYRWALAKWEELYSEAKRKARKYEEDYAWIYDNGDRLTIQNRVSRKDYEDILVPQKIRAELEG